MNAKFDEWKFDEEPDSHRLQVPPTHAFYLWGKNRNLTMEKPGRQYLNQTVKVNITSNKT